MLIPQGIGALLCRGIVGVKLDPDKIGALPIAVFGFVVVAATTIPFCYADPKTNSWLLGLWLLLRGVGLGTVTIPVMAVAYLGLDKAEIAHASVLTRTAQQIGGSFGTAVLAVILESSVAAHHGDLIAAFHVAFWWSVGFAALAALLSIWLPGRPGTAAKRAGRAAGRGRRGRQPQRARLRRSARRANRSPRSQRLRPGVRPSVRSRRGTGPVGDQASTRRPDGPDAQQQGHIEVIVGPSGRIGHEVKTARGACLSAARQKWRWATRL